MHDRRPDLGVIDRGGVRHHRRSVVDHPALAMIFLSGLLAGWLMGLLSWVVAAGRDTISQIVIVWMVPSAIGSADLHHAILGSVEVLAGVFSSRGATSWQITAIFCSGRRSATSSEGRVCRDIEVSACTRTR